MVEKFQGDSASEYRFTPDWYWYPGRFQDMDIWLVCRAIGTACLNEDLMFRQ